MPGTFISWRFEIIKLGGHYCIKQLKIGSRGNQEWPKYKQVFYFVINRIYILKMKENTEREDLR